MKVLIIYYKSSSITSTIRLSGLIKYLPDFGWEPLILTNKPSPELNKFEVITVPYDDDDFTKNLPFFLRNVNKSSSIFLRGIKYLWNAFFLYPDFQKDWYIPALNAVNELLEDQDIDAVISSFPPVTPHSIAFNLKEEYSIPWIADMRDLWTQYSYYRYKDFLPRYLREKRLELRMLPKSSCLITVSEPFAGILKKLHKKCENICVIPNGFDPDKVDPDISLTDKFNITYAGGLWEGKRDPSILFDALNQLKLENEIDINDVEINFYGPIDSFLEASAKKYFLEDNVKIHGLVSRKDVLKREQESQLLLLLRWENPDEFGVVPGKIFEYLAAKRPILAIGSKGGSVEKILNETGAGVNLVELEDLKEEIKRFYNEFKLNGEVRYGGIERRINKYSHREMARKFADILNEVC